MPNDIEIFIPDLWSHTRCNSSEQGGLPVYNYKKVFPFLRRFQNYISRFKVYLRIEAHSSFGADLVPARENLNFCWFIWLAHNSHASILFLYQSGLSDEDRLQHSFLSACDLRPEFSIPEGNNNIQLPAFADLPDLPCPFVGQGDLIQVFR